MILLSYQKSEYGGYRTEKDHQIIVSLSNSIMEVTQITTDTKPIEFVDSIIKDYTYYTQQL
jgi:hypothetical protein